MALVCQQCKHALQLDTSIVDLAPSTYDMINASLPMRRHQSPGESFVMLQDSVLKDMPTSPRVARILQQQHQLQQQPGSVRSPTSPTLQQQQVVASTSTPLSDHLRSTARLFRLLSDRTEIDHPLCAECTDVLLSSIQKQLDETKRERDGYLAFERDIKKDSKAGAQLPMRSAALAREEAAAAEELREAERDVARLNEELADLERQERELAEDEAEFWREHNRRAEQAARQEAELRSLQAAYAADRETADMLEQSNVYNDAFLIAADGPLATINGLRFGRITGAHVDWPEINAAWGQTLLLLYTIARKIDFTFDTYTMHPLGSHSRIERHGGDATTILELYYSEDNPLMRLLHNYRFDAAMVAFLECLRQLTDYVRRVSHTERFDFPVISKDKIGDASIKYGFSTEDVWTRALRQVLMTLRTLLVWVTAA